MYVCDSRHRGFLVGTLFILQAMLSVMKIVTEAKFIREDLKPDKVNLTIPEENKNEACEKEVRGEGILIDRIIYSLKIPGYETCINEINTNSSRDIQLRQTLQRECNGKNRCFITGGHAVNVLCEGNVIPANQIDIHVECLPIKPDNKTVFSIIPGLSVKVSHCQHNKSYLVLELYQVKPTEIHCQINGNGQELKFTLLHVDFGPKLNCDTFNTCHGYINITDDKMNTINYTYNSLPVEVFNKYLKLVGFDIYMSTGLLWIQLDEYKEIDVTCEKSIGTISKTQSHVTTECSISEVTGNGSNGNTAIEVESTTRGHAEDKVSAQVATLIVCVTGLFALFVIALGVVCECSENLPFRRLKRRMQSECQHGIRYPLQDESDYVTNNDVLDCTTDRSFAKQSKKYNVEDTQIRYSDYMEVNSYEETSLMTTPTTPAAHHFCGSPYSEESLTYLIPNKSAKIQRPIARSLVPNGLDTPGKTTAEQDVVTEALKLSTSRGTNNSPNVDNIRMLHSPLEETEYSHLNTCSKENFENIYDG